MQSPFVFGFWSPCAAFSQASKWIQSSLEVYPASLERTGLQRNDETLSHGLRHSHSIREKCFVTYQVFLHLKVTSNRLFTCIRTSQRPFRDCFIFALHSWLSVSSYQKWHTEQTWNLWYNFCSDYFLSYLKVT